MTQEQQVLEHLRKLNQMLEEQLNEKIITIVAVQTTTIKTLISEK